MNNRTCRHHLLAQGVVAQVEYCTDCGVFHVSMDSVTVRFRPTALRDLRDTLSAALSHFADASDAMAAGSDERKRLQ